MWGWPSAASRKLTGLGDWFERAFGVPMPDMPMPRRGLVPFLDHIEGQPAIMLGSRLEAEDPLLYGTEAMRRLSAAPPGYFLVGYWAKGVNSHAFYYSRVDAWCRVHFRIAYGGVYTDSERLRPIIPEFLRRYFRYEAESLRRGGRVESHHHMGWGQYVVTWPDGTTGREPEDQSWEGGPDGDLVGCPFERLIPMRRPG